MPNEIKKVHCHSCGFEEVTDDATMGTDYEYNSLNEYLCPECESAISISDDIDAEEIIEYIETKLLESGADVANAGILQRLLEEIRNEFVFDENKTIQLAKIFNEVFSDL